MPYWYDNYNLPYYTWVTTSSPASACPYCGRCPTCGHKSGTSQYDDPFGYKDQYSNWLLYEPTTSILSLNYTNIPS